VLIEGMTVPFVCPLDRCADTANKDALYPLVLEAPGCFT
jgi:hypothetical protein